MRIITFINTITQYFSSHVKLELIILVFKCKIEYLFDLQPVMLCELRPSRPKIQLPRDVCTDRVEFSLTTLTETQYRLSVVKIVHYQQAIIQLFLP